MSTSTILLILGIACLAFLGTIGVWCLITKYPLHPTASRATSRTPTRGNRSTFLLKLKAFWNKAKAFMRKKWKWLIIPLVVGLAFLFHEATAEILKSIGLLFLCAAGFAWILSALGIKVMIKYRWPITIVGIVFVIIGAVFGQL